MMPTEPESPATEAPAGPIAVPRPEYRWYHKMSAVLFVTFCLELGIFLLVYPWTSSWETNYFTVWKPQLQAFWDNMYVRGAISGLGVINLYIALAEAVRLRRFAKP